jgi:tryptophan-rich sensory protein
MKKILRLAVFVLVCLLAGFIGSIFTTPSVPGWYAGLVKPSFNPPNWVFAPVWTALYVVMAVSVWLVWRRYGWSGARVPLALFSIQLILNVAWSGIFFGLRMPGPAFVEIVLFTSNALPEFNRPPPLLLAELPNTDVAVMVIIPELTIPPP